ncbi:hypothetical protein IAR55_006145 [Kwoniella newhampshirensis]|uniref:C2H2-type domain-containing protein n=1 Tax=Kwoniella newhampshirensis TaxID=1651941 RepID=A0AAW0YF57_9TREE
MLIGLLLLLILFLVESPDLTSRCECECTCGRKYRISGEYRRERQGLDESCVGGVSGEDKDEQGQGQELGLVDGGEDEENDWDQSQDQKRSQSTDWEDASAPVSSHPDENVHVHEAEDQKSYWQGRPLPPHFDCADPDTSSTAWKTSNLTLGRNKKNKDGSRWCAPCSKKFGTAMALNQHNAVVHASNSSPIGPIIRPGSRVSSTEDSNPSVVMCEVCSEEYSSNYALRKHKTDKHPWSLLCAGCLITFAHAQDARDHYELVHGTTNINFRRTQRMLDTLTGTTSSPSLLQDPPTVTYRSHVVQSHFECLECGMIFGQPSDLAAHVSSLFSHGGADLTSEDFPPLIPGFGPTKSPQLYTNTHGVLEQSPTAWDTSMPSFILGERLSPAEQEAVPAATLTPDLTGDASGRQDIVGAGTDENSGKAEVPAVMAKRTEFSIDTVSSETMSSKTSDGVSETAPQPSGTPDDPIVSSSSADNDASSVVPTSKLQDTNPQPATDNEVTTFTVSASSGSATYRPHIELVPLRVKSPYVRAAISTHSAQPRLDTHTSPTAVMEKEVTTGSNGDALASDPVRIDAIEYQIPSFALPARSPVKAKFGSSSTGKAQPRQRLSIASCPAEDEGEHPPEPLTLADNDAAEEQEKDEWADSEEIYRLTWSAPKRPIMSLDLTAPENGNRPLSKFARRSEIEISMEEGEETEERRRLH